MRCAEAICFTKSAVYEVWEKWRRNGILRVVFSGCCACFEYEKGIEWCRCARDLVDVKIVNVIVGLVRHSTGIRDPVSVRAKPRRGVGARLSLCVRALVTVSINSHEGDLYSKNQCLRCDPSHLLLSSVERRSGFCSVVLVGSSCQMRQTRGDSFCVVS
ncbi:hypothetical protein Tco_0795528 [Tanacetum coccineum]